MMYRRYLAATDGSAYGDVACRYAVDLAARTKGAVLGVHVLDSRTMEGPLLADIVGGLGAAPYRSVLPQFRRLMQEKGETVAEALRSRLSDAGVPGECRVEKGHPAHVILEQEVHADMVVLGKHGEHQEWGQDMVGSTVDRVIRRAVKACLVTPGEFRPLSRLLIAYDGSDVASKALSAAGELAAALGAEIVVLTAAEGLDERAAEQVLADGIEMLALHDCKAEGLVRDGLAEACIIGVTRELGTDGIALGAYGHTRIRELILGSTSSQVVAMSDVPVLLVR
jgi:nucleotide-binding universal stress UspA family protein